MKFRCSKCKHYLTSDLYVTKRYQYENQYIYDRVGIITDYVDVNTIRSDRAIAPGSAVLVGPIRSWYTWKKSRAVASIGHADCIGMTISKFVSGAGCCGNFAEPVTCGGCSATIGIEYNDCYCDPRCIDVYLDMVEYSYSG